MLNLTLSDKINLETNLDERSAPVTTLIRPPYDQYYQYSATELKPTTKKIDFFPREIETTTPVLFDQAWSRASKKVGVVVSIASNCEKSDARERC